LAAPVVTRSGEVVGGLFFGHDRPGVFTQEAEELVAGIAAHAAIAIENARLHQALQREVDERRQAEQTKALLLNEIKHRVKNTLAIIQAIATRTFQKAPPEEREAFMARLHALANAHDLLSEEQWDTAEISIIVRRALAAFMGHGDERFSLNGPEARIDANKSLLLAMALHELATNAVKYGALSSSAGRVSIAWTAITETEPPSLSLEWRETGGPPVVPPTRRGFGTGLIERAFNHQGSAQFVYDCAGLVCMLSMTL
jgi:two-component sensor histidine kinase